MDQAVTTQIGYFNRVEFSGDRTPRSSRCEIMGYRPRVTKEDHIVAQAAGEEDMDVLTRTLPGIPHEQYRALVVAQALKLSKSPTTKDFYQAKKKVDQALVNRGIAIIIPKARPGRVTR